MLLEPRWEGCDCACKDEKTISVYQRQSSNRSHFGEPLSKMLWSLDWADVLVNGMQVPSRVRISDIFFKNIRGTSSTPVPVILNCSRGVPCHNVQLQNVHLDHPGGTQPTSTCRNVKAIYSGTQIPPPCA